jgi:DNA-binding XRE family transcriptional regulator
MVALASGLAKSHVNDIETGRIEPSWEGVFRLARVLGGDVGVRFYPGTGPLVRDHIQSAMIGALLGMLHETWRPRPEVAVYRPVRGVIDLVLDRALGSSTIACEAQSELRRLEQQVRWSRAKADALGATLGEQAGAAAHAPSDDRPTPRIGRLLLLRSTPRTRAAVAEYADLVAAAYPARAIDAYAALVGRSSWPGDALLWCRIEDGRATVLDRPPRGIRVGR